MIKSQSGNRQAGSSLIEVLITVLVVSIGLLGMASLQLRSMTMNQAAYQNLQAVNLAYDIADRILVNSAQAAAGDYTITLAASSSTVADSIATDDVTEWFNTVARLPEGDFSIAAGVPLASAANIRVHRVTICWFDKNNTDAGTQNANCGNQTRRGEFSFNASSRTKN